MSKHAFTAPPPSSVEIKGDGVLSTQHALVAAPDAAVDIAGGAVADAHRLTVPEAISIAVNGGGSALKITVTELGVPGPSAYQVAVKTGFVGTEAEWVASLASDQVPAFDLDLVAIYTLSK